MALPLFVTILLIVCCSAEAMPVLLSLTDSQKASTSSATDRAALLSFRSHIKSDPSRALASWGNQSIATCLWRGVTCGLSGRVTALDLPGLGLLGVITPELGNLTYLTQLHLPQNRLSGALPPELGNLLDLQHLDISENSIGGQIPPSLSNCRLLETMNFSSNRLQLEIPHQLGSLKNLKVLHVGNNNLTGSIPSEIGDLVNLNLLDVSYNNLTGKIPSEIGELKGIGKINLKSNQLMGPIPSTLGNLSALTYISIRSNKLTGSIPPLQGLSSISFLQLADNNLTGRIPSWLGNLSSLTVIDFRKNGLVGNIPESLGDLKLLKALSLSFNKLVGSINNITGKIPESIGNLIGLNVLGMDINLFEGNIPSSIGNLKKLNALSISNNNLSGSIPVTFGNLSALSRLGLDGNSLSGGIPSSLSRCPLQDLNLSHNRLTGPIPKELFLVSTLSNSLILDHNLLTGPLPSEVGNLRNVAGLDFSSNNISGEIPPSIGNCQSLQHLSISGNFLQGVIPSSLGQLNGLLELDLSHNNLSGRIPNFLGNMRGLTNLNLSFNNFEGEVPKDGIFLNVTAISILGNNGLCGGISQLNLPLCSSHPSNTHSQKKTMVISIVAGVLFLTSVVVLFAIIHWRSKTRREEKHESLLTEQHMRVSYAELVNATNDFSSENLVGVGSFGSVYKGRMTNHDQQLVIAVKVFNLQTRGALKSFDAECETLRYVRHRNLLKVLTVCSSTDFRGDDFKALIYEFLPNGNLNEWLHLHPEMEGEKKVLDLVQRISIAIDVASAIDYLHHHNPFPIIHCDLKPTNVLLDNNMVAQVGDFGLARFLHEDSSDILEQSTGWAAMRGTIGYAAPEYGQGNNASIQGDVYSFGILLLEMFTGKRPTDSEVTEGCNLHKYVEMALQDQAINVIDQHLLSVTEDDEGRTRGNQQTIREKRIACIVSALEIGISCSKDLPADRMQIRDALKELLVDREKLIRGS
ncbi:receptor kinase-like protein Xa21 [Setaria italica]|uniref:receptor kinase-like protein Xa21 n=1 Tax=Setaria italica TaxID=4555 RepID=UPI000BE5A36F|nr:receptor kinase-like protein Xa21 [Setaria italica]